MRRTLPILALAALGNLAHGQVIPTRYAVAGMTPVDLGTLDGDESTAYDINDLGDVVGYIDGPYHRPEAFIYLDGQMLTLHDNSIQFLWSAAYGINNARVVVGTYEAYDPGDAWNAVQWDDNRGFFYYPGIWMTPLSNHTADELGAGWQTSASAVNSANKIVGGASRPTAPAKLPALRPAPCRATHLAISWQFSWEDPAPLFCSPANLEGMDARSADINDAGSIVGTDGGVSPTSMFLFKNGQRHVVPAPAGVPQVDGEGHPLHGAANGINNQNWVAGTYGHGSTDAAPHLRAFIWDGVAAASTSLGTLPAGTWSDAREINEQRMVAGIANRVYGKDVARHAAFIWHEDFGMVQLPPLEYSGARQRVPGNCQARSLNSLRNGRVQVVGECDIDGNRHAVRWDIQVTQVSRIPLSM